MFSTRERPLLVHHGKTMQNLSVRPTDIIIMHMPYGYALNLILLNKGDENDKSKQFKKRSSSV